MSEVPLYSQVLERAARDSLPGWALDVREQTTVLYVKARIWPRLSYIWPRLSYIWPRLSYVCHIRSTADSVWRGALVFKAHKLLYHSTLGWRVIKKKERGACILELVELFDFYMKAKARI